jgi:Dyp-type peroxidase family
LNAQDVEENKAVFNRIQGYSLVSHGRDYVWLALLQVRDRSPEGKAQLRRSLAEYGQGATPAYDLYQTFRGHLQARQSTGEQKSPPPLVKAVGLSSSGYSLLAPDSGPPGKSFANGFRKNFEDLIPNLPEDRYDAILVLAGDDPQAQLPAEQREIESRFGDRAAITWEQGTAKMQNGIFREHFGFRDGISQPVFFEENLPPGDPARRAWDPSASLSYVLTREPGTSNGSEFGSHLAFLKIRQDRQAFEEIARQAALYVSPSVSPETIQEWMMGRKINGDPLVPAGSDQDDFNYQSDRDFRLCPAASHVRKMNPRTAEGRGKRVFRRSVLYGKEGEEQGMLFQCFQSSLADGFEFLMRQWAMNDGLPALACGKDGILGPRPHPPLPAGTTLAPETPLPFSLQAVLDVRYGEYFYLPSIAFFNRLQAI